MASRRYLTVVVVAIFLVVGGEAVTGARRRLLQLAPSCPAVYADLRPCIPYLSTGNGKPSSECCSGVSQLQPYSTQKTDRVAICQCLKSLGSLVPGLDLSVASKLPKKCKVNVKLPKLSLNIDCSKA
ncbi:Non-specific lipid-transfer protein 11 [Linum grandiflorum]